TSLGLWKSTDGGVNWVDVFSNSAAARQIGTSDVLTISLDPFTPNHIVASFHFFWNGNGASGVVESKDGGQTWVVHNPAGAWDAGNGVWFGNNSNTWIVGTQGAGIWITTNAGASWRQFSTNNISHGGGGGGLRREPVSGALIVGTGTTFLQSFDNGTTW